MEGRIEKLDNLGRGILYDNEKITFIPKCIPEDFVEFTIIKSKKNYNEGKLIKVIKESPKRVKPLCPYFNNCGGCDLQNLSYIDSISYKLNRTITNFKIHKLDIKPIVIQNPYPYNYRNKVTLKVVNGLIGYYEENTHNIIKIDNCNIASNCINNVIHLLKNINLYNGNVVIRCNKNNEILLIFNTKDKIDIDIEYIKSKIKLVGIVVNNQTIYGDNFLYEIIDGIIYKISYDSFFQVNPYVAQELFKIVQDNINESDKVLDIYSGVGTLSLNASKKASSVIGIEIVPNAVLNACFNAKINKRDNLNFVLNDASDAARKINDKFNTIIVDPPRSGLSKEVIELILNTLPQKLIYVSCDQQTLLRDLDILTNNYEIKNVYILDMFSYTYHVESIAILVRR